MRRKLDRKDLITQLRKHYSPGAPISAGDVRRNPKISHPSTFRRYFKKGLKEAAKKAGLNFVPRRKLWTKESVRKAIKDFVKNSGRAPATKDLNTTTRLPHFTTLERLFGSYPKALKACGIDYAKLGRKKWLRKGTHEQVLAILKKKCKALGKVPTVAEIDHDKTMPSSSLYRRRFGNIERALKTAGINVHKLKKTKRR